MSEGDWHIHHKSYFTQHEICIGTLRADAVYDKFAFEFQDKHTMTQSEIDNKNKVYSECNFIPVWIINMNHRMIITDNDKAKCTNFINDYKNCKNIFLSYNNQILNMNSKSMNEDAFYNYLKLHHKLPPDSEYHVPEKIRYPFELKYQQYGAGGGKTYGIVKDTIDKMQSVKGFNVIILTKVHTAKSEIRKKLMSDELKPEGLIEKPLDNKKYFEFRLNEGTIVIATIDSFLYSIIDRDCLSDVHSQNMFRELANKLSDENNLSANILFKDIPIIKSRIYIDEAQDLSQEYIYLLRAACIMYGVEFILVGDLWQSLYDVHNLYYTIIKNPPSDCKIERLNPDMKYYCRRFENINLALHHNEHFYNNKEFMNYCTETNLMQLHQPIETDNVKFSSNVTLNNDYILNDPVEYITVNDPETDTKYTMDAIDEEKYQELEDTIIKIFKSIPDSNPQDWCIIVPYMKSNYAAHQLVNTINIYWHKTLSDADENLLLCKSYSSESGEPIKIEDNDRDHKTLMMTIHASKGQIFKYVICLGCQYEYITIYPQCYKSKNLFYWSMINVTWTRASHRMFIVNYETDSNDLQYRQPHDTDFDASNERVIEILNKIDWYEDYENKYKLNNQSKSSSQSILIDNNYQTLRYHIICSLMKFLLTYVKGSSQFFAKIIGCAEGGFKFCRALKDFMLASKDYVKDNKRPMPLYDYSEYYPNAMNKIKEVIDLYGEIKTRNDVYPFKKKIDNKSRNGDISYLLVWGYMMLQRNGNIYKQNDYQTLCEVLELISTNDSKLNIDIKNYMKKVRNLITTEYEKFGYDDGATIGFSNTSHPFTWQIDNPHTIYSPNVLAVPLLKTEKEKRKQYFGDMNRNIDYVILNPTNSELNFINFDSELLKALITFVCIKAETNQEKNLVLITPSKDVDNIVIEFDFRGKISNDDYEYLLDYIKETCEHVNDKLGKRISDAIIKRLNVSSLGKKELKQVIQCMQKDKTLKNNKFTIDVLYAILRLIDSELQSNDFNDVKEFIRNNVENEIHSIITYAYPSYS